MKNTCPYCLTAFGIKTRDHIFPQFLGGSQTIAACKECNDHFGQWFEGPAARRLQEIQVFMMTWGLSLKLESRTWKRAWTVDGHMFDLTVADELAHLELSTPQIARDEFGRIASATFRTQKELDHFLGKLFQKLSPQDVILEPILVPSTNLSGLSLNLEIGPDLQRTAMKICLATSTLLPIVDPGMTASGRQILASTEVDLNQTTRNAFTKYDQLDELRPGLSHLVYVESTNQRCHGIVQFFGFLQIYCELGEGGEDQAVLGFLDPVTGEESFRQIVPIKPAPPPLWLRADHVDELMAGWLMKLRQDAINRGATHPPNWGPTNSSFSGMSKIHHCRGRPMESYGKMSILRNRYRSKDESRYSCVRLEVVAREFGQRDTGI